MPQIRDYTQATSLLPTDAFVIDRDAFGTMWIDGLDALSSAGLVPRCLTYVIDGGGIAFSTGVAGVLYVPFAVTLKSVTLLADQVGSVQLDIKTGTYANYATGTSIVAAAPPTISAAIKAQDTTLTGWTTAIPAGNFLQFSVTSVATITRLTIALAA